MVVLITGLFSGLATAGVTVGVLPSDGTTVRYSDSLDVGELHYYTFTTTGDITDGAGTYLNIQTYALDGMTHLDSMIGLYDSSSQFVAYDDDDNSDLNTDGDYYELYSLLSFGPDDPYENDNYNPPYGVYLAAGTYTLVVGECWTEFTTDMADIVPEDYGWGGDYVLQFSTVYVPVSTVPVPSAALLAASGLAGLVRFRRKLRKNETTR
jgi:hypothetical protein